MDQPGKPAAPLIGKPPIQFTNEIRYAVVMYGGVSLCIYINGVAQELLELARATAPDASESHSFWTTENLSASAKVYRRLGQYLDSDRHDAHLLRRDSAEPIRTRFVVDVLSGTSAGGLNSIFLAKALANNQDMRGLKELWMNEGDIGVLLNDAKSVKDEPHLAFPKDPASLLNSQRMYDKLLTALHEMDFPGQGNGRSAAADNVSDTPPPASPLVEELDLYVTATDLRGLPIHIKIQNGVVVDELRHRNVFRFRYGSLSSDFGSDLNPLLAFAGRCTSSIPPAFEPMRLEDIEPVLEAWPHYRAMIQKGRVDWSRFYSDYAKTEETGDFWKRDFGDGGFLDNKPFSYATGALMRRQAERPVSRKLLYIEPNPESLGTAGASKRLKPNALEHSMAALIGLPRYETIREDLEAVLERNRLLEQIDAVTREVDRDVNFAIKKGLIEDVTEAGSRQQEADKFAATPLKEMIEERGRGISYGIYHRLKMASVTADLAVLVTDLLGYSRSSDESVAVRQLIEEWTNCWFVEDPAPELIAKNWWPKTQTRFLLDFDPGYRLRRLFFLHRKITYFYRLGPDSPEATERDLLPQEVAALLLDPERWRRFRSALLEIKRALAKVLLELRMVGRQIRGDQELLAALKQALPREEIARWTQNRQQISTVVKDKTREVSLKDISDRIAGHYIAVFKKTSAMSAAALSPDGFSGEERTAREVLWRIHRHFHYYDMAIFPVQYGAGSAETPHVDILRVSPGDAKNLCENQKGRRKLAGTEFFSFGAFFAEVWRKNDMLWGRLDGAEILVRNLLAKTPAHTQLAATDDAFGDHPGLNSEARSARRTVADLVIDDLHAAILNDHLRGAQRAEVWQVLQRLLPRTERDKLEAGVADFVGDSEQLNDAMQRLITFCKSDEQLLCHYKESYAVDRELDRGELLKVVSRATKIFGKMLQNVASESGKAGKEIPALVTRVAAVFSGILELSLPRSAPELLWRYWRSLLYVIGLLLFMVGLIFGVGPVQKGGLMIVAVTFAIHLATSWLELWIRRWPWLNRVVATLLSLLLASLVFLGVWKATELPELVQNRFQKAYKLFQPKP
ncbi:MAG: patatin-like protein [Chthoniobacterales bacterium]